MSRLIRMDRTGHTELASWTVGDETAERVAHLLLALREDEEGFATVANRSFSGATWRLRMQLPKRVRPALA